MVSKKQINIFIFLFLIITQTNYILSAIETPSNNLYTFNVQLLGENSLPAIQLYSSERTYPEIFILDINIEKTWLFRPNPRVINYDQILKTDFYTILGYSAEDSLYLENIKNELILIKDLKYIKVVQINSIKNFNHNGKLSINRLLSNYNFISKITFDENNNTNKPYFGFSLQFWNNNGKEEGKFSIGNLLNDVDKLYSTNIPLINNNENKWQIYIKGIFIGDMKEATFEKEINITNEKFNGIYLNSSMSLETAYNSIYVNKDVLNFLDKYYFNKDGKNLCYKNENDDEIIYNCHSNGEPDNIYLVFENNITLILNKTDLFNCKKNNHLINENIKFNLETCEFNIKYNKNIKNNILGFSVLKNFKSYFLFNDNNFIIESKDRKIIRCNFMDEEFQNLKSEDLKDKRKIVYELIKTILSMIFVFALLFVALYIHEKFFDGEYKKPEIIINRTKYNNL